MWRKMNNNLLNQLTTKCPSGTLRGNKENEKIKTIIENIDTSKYKIIIENGYILVSNIHFNSKEKFITISSHVDNVYSACFCKQQNDVLLGTFDNSLTNYVMLLLMKELDKTQIVYIFADNEESDNPDILNVPLFSYKTFLFNICLDVTPYCHYTHICTIENDNFNLAKKIKKMANKDVAAISVYQSMNDESSFLNQQNIKSFSFCITCNFANNRCHSEDGGSLSIEKLQKYFEILKDYLLKYTT